MADCRSAAAPGDGGLDVLTRLRAGQGAFHREPVAAAAGGRSGRHSNQALEFRDGSAGSVLIGTAQGTLSGLAFWVVGIDGALFWGAMMAVLSIIPGIGGALVWVPTAVVLLATGEVWRGLGLAAFCGLGVGSVYNALRPILVGRDTQMTKLTDFFLDAWGPARLRRHGLHRRPDPGRTVPDRLGNVRLGVPERARGIRTSAARSGATAAAW